MAHLNLEMHSNFKSVLYPVETMDDLVYYFTIDDYLKYISGYFFYGEYDFLEGIEECHMEQWQPVNFYTFKIDYRKIDRFYTYSGGEEDSYSETYFRMDHHGQSVYVHLKVEYNLPGGGEVYMTYDPEVFLRAVVEWQEDTLSIWQSLVDDGHDLEEPQEFDFMPPTDWKSTPSLKQLCLHEVYSNLTYGGGELQNYSTVLPKSLINSVEKYIRIQEAWYTHSFIW